MANERNVFKYLDVSTGNLPEGVARLILRDEHPKVIAKPHDYGAWVWVPPDDGDDVHDVSAEYPALDAIFKEARRLDCQWINFDSDAAPLEGFPFFNW